jgi:hypothetical protein
MTPSMKNPALRKLHAGYLLFSRKYSPIAKAIGLRSMLSIMGLKILSYIRALSRIPQSSMRATHHVKTLSIACIKVRVCSRAERMLK